MDKSDEDRIEVLEKLIAENLQRAKETRIPRVAGLSLETVNELRLELKALKTKRGE